MVKNQFVFNNINFVKLKICLRSTHNAAKTVSKVNKARIAMLGYGGKVWQDVAKYGKMARSCE